VGCLGAGFRHHREGYDTELALQRCQHVRPVCVPPKTVRTELPSTTARDQSICP